MGAALPPAARVTDSGWRNASGVTGALSPVARVCLGDLDLALADAAVSGKRGLSVAEEALSASCTIQEEMLKVKLPTAP